MHSLIPFCSFSLSIWYTNAHLNMLLPKVAAPHATQMHFFHGLFVCLPLERWARAGKKREVETGQQGKWAFLNKQRATSKYHIALHSAHPWTAASDQYIDLELKILGNSMKTNINKLFQKWTNDFDYDNDVDNDVERTQNATSSLNVNVFCLVFVVLFESWNRIKFSPFHIDSLLHS